MSEKIKIKPEQLEQAVSSILSEYKESISTKVKKAVDDAGKEAVDQLKRTSPRRVEGSKGYYKSWRKRVTKETADVKEVTVYSTQPGLPHLLEHGHALRNGGRTRAFPHIAPAEQMVTEKLEKEIVEAIERG